MNQLALVDADVSIYYTIYPPLFPLFYRLTRLLRADFGTNVPLFGVAFVLMILCRNLYFSVIFLALHLLGEVRQAIELTRVLKSTFKSSLGKLEIHWKRNLVQHLEKSEVKEKTEKSMTRPRSGHHTPVHRGEVYLSYFCTKSSPMKFVTRPRSGHHTPVWPGRAHLEFLASLHKLKISTRPRSGRRTPVDRGESYLTLFSAIINEPPPRSTGAPYPDRGGVNMTRYICFFGLLI